ncbi:MAG: TrgA family protein [Proteobacteria bacterium]|nr:TrgA family protein [Pseudomonadota bacterium]MBS0573708.1 TrgA family protein [Pseudomonadota bacterium]
MQTPMPTASRLFAALAFALVGFFTAEVFKPHMPEGTQFGAFSQISALIGLVSGWRVLGPETGRGMLQAANSGLRAGLVMLLLGLLIFSTEEMIVLAFRRTYHGPMEAIVGIVALAVGYLRLLFAPDVLAVVIGGSVLAGCLSEWAGRRWK